MNVENIRQLIVVPEQSQAPVAPFLANAGFSIINKQIPSGEFEIIGDLCQIVHVNVLPGQKLQLEPGTMCYMSEASKIEVKIGGFGRLLTEGNLFKDIYHNIGSQVGFVGITANFPATIIPINMEEFGGEIHCKHDAFLASVDENSQVSMSRLNAASCLACCCAGVGFFVQKIRARGWVFLAAHGSIIEKTLAAGEEVVCHTHSLVAMSPSVTVDVRQTGNCSTMCCGGEGMFNTALKGPGKVYLSSMPLEKLRRLFPRPQPRKKKGAAGAVVGLAGAAAGL